MPKLILTVGASNSGKTTWTQALCSDGNTVNLNRDNLRAEFCTASGDLKDYKFSKAKERKVTGLQRTMAEYALTIEKMNVVISDTNLNQGKRDSWKDFAEDLGVDYEEIHFFEPLKVLLERNLKRDYSVPTSVIFNQFMQMQKILGHYIYEPTEGLPECVIVDIDGTLADHEGIRSPFDWVKVDLDRPNKDVVEYVKMLADRTNIEIIIFSGRDECSRELTEKWLIQNEIGYSALYMRPEGNTECDTVIKRNMFDRHIKGKYNVSHVIDDRPKVVDMWWSLGLKVWSVANQLVRF